jgi:hypothetical protein
MTFFEEELQRKRPGSALHVMLLLANQDKYPLFSIGCNPVIASEHYLDSTSHLERLMRSSKNGVRSIIKTCVTVGTRRALTGGFRVLEAALDACVD